MCKYFLTPFVHREDLVVQTFGTLGKRTGPKFQQGPMESSTPAAPAIPHEELLPQLLQYCLSERMARMLQREPDFDQLRFRSHQIYFVKDFAQRNDGQDLSIHQLSRAFGCDAGQIKAALENSLNDRKVRGRHFAFDDESEIQILE
jgi:hypothetical protein